MKRASPPANHLPAVHPSPVPVVIRAATTIELTLSDAEIERIAAAVAQRLAPAPPPRPDYLTVDEAAQACRCSTRQIRRLFAIGRLRATKIASGGSSRLLITRCSVDALLAEGT